MRVVCILALCVLAVKAGVVKDTKEYDDGEVSVEEVDEEDHPALRSAAAIGSTDYEKEGKKEVKKEHYPHHPPPYPGFPYPGRPGEYPPSPYPGYPPYPEHGGPQHGERPPYPEHGGPKHGERPPYPEHGGPEHGERPPYSEHGGPKHGERPPYSEHGGPKHGERPPYPGHGGPQHGERPPYPEHRPRHHDEDKDYKSEDSARHAAPIGSSPHGHPYPPPQFPGYPYPPPPPHHCPDVCDLDRFSKCTCVTPAVYNKKGRGNCNVGASTLDLRVWCYIAKEDAKHCPDAKPSKSKPEYFWSRIACITK